MYWSPNILAVAFKKQEILEQIVTRMQDLASEFSKIFRRWSPWPSQWGGGRRPLLHRTPSPAFGRARAQATRCWDPNLV